MSGFTGNPSGVRKVLAVVVVIFALGAAGYCSTSDAAEGLTVGFGKASVGSEVCFDSLLVTQELADRRWVATLATHGDGYCRDQDVRANIGAGILRTTHLGRWAIGIGPSVWHHGDRAFGPREGGDRPELAAQIAIRRYLLRERLVLDLLHASTGGSAEVNPGRNFLVLGGRF